VDILGNHQLVDFPTSRRAITDTLAAGKKLHHVAALLEFDMTEPRAKIARHKASGRDVSFTAWIVSVVGKLLGDNREINCYRQGFSKVVVFDDADVSIVVERNVDGRKQPLPYVVRKANEKDCFSITREIRRAQSEILEGGNLVLGDSKMPAWVMNAWLHMPGVVRGVFWDYLRHDGKLAKKTMGTAVVTSIGMFGKFPGWAIPIGLHTVEFAIGGSYRRPAEVDGKIDVREFLRVTVLIDHDLVDGAPAARVVDQLTDLMERGWGLD
jgi:pyruvate/2-oxoglutarate dehydrogenase complex dihydrolipoamide acyltransferase (E2) component